MVIDLHKISWLISEHTHNTGHKPLWNEVKCIDRDPYYYARRVKEAMYIRLHSDNINRDSGIEIQDAWMPKIKKKHNKRRAIFSNLQYNLESEFSGAPWLLKELLLILFLLLRDHSWNNLVQTCSMYFSHFPVWRDQHPWYHQRCKSRRNRVCWSADSPPQMSGCFDFGLRFVSSSAILKHVRQ